jgi:hypothetical protein
MKILVATEETQGHRPNDFCWAEEGEIVTFGSQCAEEVIDGPCGCRRALRGLKTRKATTTFRVMERPDLQRADLVGLVAESLVAGGWYPGVKQARAAAIEHTNRLAAVALAHTEGSILERRDDRFVLRSPARADRGADRRPTRSEDVRRAARR